MAALACGSASLQQLGLTKAIPIETVTTNVWPPIGTSVPKAAVIRSGEILHVSSCGRVLEEDCELFAIETSDCHTGIYGRNQSFCDARPGFVAKRSGPRASVTA